ncbi:MAG: alpha-E domain-containing protein [Kiloniellales bacterium]|nr:alpha-E domain-containing protein [Kiloniellales bacterium]
MLSRSAEDLFWMMRYMERAENTARILDVSNRMAVLPTVKGSRSLHWAPALEIGPDPSDFHKRYEEADQKSVISYMAVDRKNASSIWSCLHQARENARAERSKISTEMWESLNATWLDIENLDFEGLESWGYRKFFDWIKDRCHLL